MTFPFFYIENYDSSQTVVVLDENTSRHVVQVLRMGMGEKIHLTDGAGNLLTAEITEPHKKHCSVKMISSHADGYAEQDTASHKTTIAVSLVKNNSRFEWFLEKATEIGVSEIIPLLCERTEKQKFRADRMKSILVSAMLQSKQCRLPLLHDPVAFSKVIEQAGQSQKFIAHCMEEDKKELADIIQKTAGPRIILIGPEGDFTKREIQMAMEHGFIPVSLGKTRLRTETAALTAAVLLVSL